MCLWLLLFEAVGKVSMTPHVTVAALMPQFSWWYSILCCLIFFNYLIYGNFLKVVSRHISALQGVLRRIKVRKIIADSRRIISPPFMSSKLAIEHSVWEKIYCWMVRENFLLKAVLRENFYWEHSVKRKTIRQDQIVRKTLSDIQRITSTELLPQPFAIKVCYWEKIQVALFQ